MRFVPRMGVLALVFILLSLPVDADPLPSQQQFILRSWDQDDGLPSTRVNAIARTPDGYLWLATYGGLARFDGVSFSVFNADNAPPLGGSLITALGCDHTGKLWIGTAVGKLAVWQNHQFMAVNLPTLVDGKRINAICEDANGVIWLAVQSGGIISLQGTNIQSYGLGEGLSGLNSMALTLDKAGTLWALNDGRLDGFMGGRWTPAIQKSDNLDGICSVAPANDGGLWLATSESKSDSRGGKIFRFRDGAIDEASLDYPWPQDTSRSHIEKLREDKAGQLWCATTGNGVYCRAIDEGWQLMGADSALARANTISLFDENDGSMLIGTRTAGLYRARPSLVTTLRLPVEASRNVVNSVCFRKDGSLWAGTDGAGIYCWRGTNRLHFAAAQGLSSLDVSAMIESADTNLYAATAGGLFKLAGNGFEAAVLPSRAKDACRSLMNDRDGDLWVGTQHGIVKVGVFQTEIIGLGGRRPFYVGCFAQNNSGDIYVAGVGGGVFQLAGTNLNRLQTSSGIRLQSVRSIAFDSVNDLWGGSSGESLICREGEKYYQWNYQDDHLPSNHHFALLADDGIIWVSSENGIFGCPVEGLKKYNRNASNPLTVWRLTTADGLAEKVCSGGGQPAASRSPNGWLWFPDGSTVAGFDPRKVTKKMPVFAPLLESVYVDGGLMNLPSDSKLKLKSGAERFEFHFTSPNLIAPERLRFRYQLAGLDADWVNVENRRVAYYTHLPPGDYTFKSQVSGPSGEWKEQPVGFRIQIFPRFWERTSFRVGIVVVSLFLVGVVAWAVERSRSRRRLERLEMQRKLDKERQRIARDIHDDLGSGLTEIIMMSDIAELEGGSNSVVSKTKKIAERARTLTRAMDEVVWALNPRNDSFESFLTYLNRWAQSYLNHARINCRWDIPLDIPEIPLHADLRHHLFLACKEALNNAVKYAKATEIWIRCELTESQITLSVEDNGVGFAVNTPSERGNGLKNMRQRLEELNGRCEIESAAERGTIIRFQVPRSEESTRR